jgi:hypothetical protein
LSQLPLAAGGSWRGPKFVLKCPGNWHATQRSPSIPILHILSFIIFIMYIYIYLISIAENGREKACKNVIHYTMTASESETESGDTIALQLLFIMTIKCNSDR